MKITPPSPMSLPLPGGTPGGPAGGDLGGTFPSPTVVSIGGVSIADFAAQFLTVINGGKGTVKALGTLGATETISLSDGNLFWGTLDQNCTIGTTGWVSGKDCQILIELDQNGTGGWTPTFSGVTWIGSAATSGAAGTVQHVVLFSRDGGTTIYASVLGGSGTGAFLTVVNGGGGTVQAHGNLGSTETIDTANGNYHWGTLNANCTFTFTTTVDTAERWFTLELIEDGTGGRTVTWPGSVSWLGGSTPAHTTTAGTTTIYAFFTRNGGTTWIGGQLGAGAATFATPAIVLGTAAAAGAASTVIRSDSTIVAFDATLPANIGTAATGSAAVAARRDHVHGITAAVLAAHGVAGEVLMVDGVSSPPEPIQTEDGTAWLYSDLLD